MDNIKCDVCGKSFVPGNRIDGLPNGVSFVMQDGTMITYCVDCLIKDGKKRTNKEQKNKN